MPSPRRFACGPEGLEDALHLKSVSTHPIPRLIRSIPLKAPPPCPRAPLRGHPGTPAACLTALVFSAVAPSPWRDQAASIDPSKSPQCPLPRLERGERSFLERT